MQRSGFTLIELSIVLVIVGLVAGAVFVGRDLIHVSQIRAVVGQYERFNTAINTFRGKYNYLPGDIPPSIASQWGLFSGLSGGAKLGDGDGWLAATGGLCSGETLVFWRHLSELNLIEGAYANDPAHPINALTGGITTSGPSELVSPIGFLPKSSFGRDIYWGVYSDGIDPPPPLPPTTPVFATGKSNYYMMYAISYFWAGGNCNATQKSLTPNEAYAIDTKLDDGIPRLGRVHGAGEAAPTWSATPISGACTTRGANILDSTSIYNTQFGDIPSCRLVLRF